MSLQDRMSEYYSDHIRGTSTDLKPFMQGRQYYAFDRFPPLANGETVSYKLTITQDMIVDDFSLLVFEGSAVIEAFAGSTEDTAFSTTVPIFPKNGLSISEDRASTSTLSRGGTFSGGTIVGIGQARETVTPLAFLVDKLRNDIRGFAPQTLFVRVSSGVGTLAAAAEGNIRVAWEELDET